MNTEHAITGIAGEALGRRLHQLADTELADRRLIEDALQRLEAGTYGRCVACAQPITAERLRVVPWAARCVSCHEVGAASDCGDERLQRRRARQAVVTATHPRFELSRAPTSWRLRGVGSCAPSAFAQIGLALTATITPPDDVRAKRPAGIHCRAPDLVTLLGAWMKALAAHMASREQLFRRFILRIDTDNALAAVGWGEPLNPAHQATVPWIGTACFSRLGVREQPGGAWVAECDLSWG